MATSTPKLDRIITEFGRRINQHVTYDGSDDIEDVSGGMLGVDYVAYVNKAMFKLFNDFWLQVGADKDAFVEVFPELHAEASASVLTDASGRTYLGQDYTFYDIANPLLHMFRLTGMLNITDDVRVKIYPDKMYGKLLEKSVSQHMPSATNQISVQIGTRVFLFCGVKTQKSLLLYFIRLPLNPTDGAFLLQNGSYDSPFTDQWNSKIAEIAEQLYRTDTQETV